MSPPVLYFLDPETTDASASITENNTRATSTAYLNYDPNVIDNPDFNSTALPWILTFGSNNIALLQNSFGIYINSDLDEQGLIAVGVYVPNGALGYWEGFIVQNFTVPEDVSSFNISVRYRIASFIGSFTFIRIEIYDYNTSSSVYPNDIFVYSASSAYTWENITVTGNLYSNHTYEFRIGLRSFIFSQGLLQMNVGYAGIELSTMRPAFAGEIIRINVTDAVYAKLRITSVYSSGSFTGYVSLTGENSSTIYFENSIPLSNETAFVLLNVSDNSLYPSGYIEASMTADSASTYMTIEAVVIYIKGGSIVECPINIHFRT